MRRLSVLIRKALSMFWLLTIPIFANDSNLNIDSLNLYSISTNRNFKVIVNGQPIFFRIGRDHPEHIGINRASEMMVYTIAESLGIAPKLIGYEIKHGLLMTAYIEGASPKEEEVHQPQFIEKVIKHLHCLHAYQSSEFKTISHTVFSRNNELLNTLTHLDSRENLKEQIDRWLRIKHSIESDYYHDIPMGICHGDLFRGNILQDENATLFFVDWEYSFYGYVIDDIGKFCSSNWLNNDEIELVSNMYWGTSNDELIRKLHQNIFMQQFNFFLWCHIQAVHNFEENTSFYEIAKQVEEYLNHY